MTMTQDTFNRANYSRTVHQQITLERELAIREMAREIGIRYQMPYLP